MKSFLKQFVKQMFCDHDYIFYRNIYGDEIISAGFKRSIDRCPKCGKIKLVDRLQKENVKMGKLEEVANGILKFGVKLGEGTEPKKVKFELGKCYKHTTGVQMKIVGGVESTMYGSCLMGEYSNGLFHPVGKDGSCTENWIEISEEEWMTNFS